MVNAYSKALPAIAWPNLAIHEVLKPCVRLLSVEPFPDATVLAIGLYLQVPTPRKRPPGLHRSLDLHDRDMPTTVASGHHQRKKTKSSFSGRTARDQGPYTSPTVSSSRNTQGSLPEVFAFLTTVQQVDQDDHQRHDWEHPTEPSVSRRRPGGDLMMASGTTPSRTWEARLRHRHRQVPDLGRCSGESLSTSSREAESGRLTRVTGADGFHGCRRNRRASGRSAEFTVGKEGWLEEANLLEDLRDECVSSSRSSSLMRQLASQAGGEDSVGWKACAVSSSYDTPEVTVKTNGATGRLLDDSDGRPSLLLQAQANWTVS
ncbi:hypothetical protein HPB51_006126 [Rhipicephalus microplus]|uniref:Uncharacterized protein n=1 Tax=Rhipicephalus microplus TaxID=6941 RepID=A0A9J6ER33_RHIMP|nr:hypothetical protein HPB51_006126 [Rhipicephalus microplus]